jgi:hypothetical protein
MRAPAAAAAGCETDTTPSGEAAITEEENRQSASQRVQVERSDMGVIEKTGEAQACPGLAAGVNADPGKT